jgi:hypothetical protein
MPKNDDGYILDKFRKTINLLSLGQTKRKRFSEDSLAIVNTPALLGKRDALYENAISLLQKDMFSMNAPDRSRAYEKALSYLISGIETGEQIFFAENFKEKEKHENSPLNHYMLLLADTVQSSFVLCNHGLVYEGEKDSISDFIGGKATIQIKADVVVFLGAEKKVLDCAKSLIEKAVPSIESYKSLLKKTMSKEDEVRYKRAYSEFIETERETEQA